MRGASSLVLPKRTKEGERGDAVGYAVRRARSSLLPPFSSSFVSFGYQLSLGGRTRRSSERAPAATPSGDAGALGGWLPSLTSDVRNEHHDEVAVGYALLTRAFLVFLKGVPSTPEDSDRGASLVQYRPSETDEPFPGAVRAPNVAGVYRVYILQDAYAQQSAEGRV
jgi:hypothetical protein